jgi:hypothetical protein
MDRHSGSRGFSMVEMMVALVFTMILMAGLGQVFKSSLSASYLMGEKISSLRRNRGSMDLLYDDLNSAGMVLVDVTSPLTANSNQPFYIVPNTTIAGAGASDPQTTDILYAAFDQPLAFQGTLKSGGGAGTVGATAASAVLSGATLTVNTDNQYVIDCGDPAYAAAVQAQFNLNPNALYLVIKDDLTHAALQVDSISGVSGNRVTLLTKTTPTTLTQATGRGDFGTLRPNQRVQDSGVVFVVPAQMVRYRIAMMNLNPDPGSAAAVPCLIRELAGYDPNADPSSSAYFGAPLATSVIAEDVAGFKVYLSADSGADWAGTGVTATGFTDGWTGGIRAALNSQVLATSRSGYTTTTGDAAWYRDIPVMVRLDITTRTALKRTEYSGNGNSALYKTVTQSLVMVPRHFGLPLK